MSAISRPARAAASIKARSSVVGTRDWGEYTANVPRTSFSFANIGWDHPARIAFLRASPRYSSRQMDSLATSGTITRAFKKAAVPHKPVSAATGKGVIARSQSLGTFGPAVGHSLFPSGSINRIVVNRGEI